MKKHLFILLLFMLLVLFSFTVPKDQSLVTVSDTAFPSEMDSHLAESKNGSDFDNRFGRGYQNIIETDDAYYYCSFSGKYLYYYDKQSGISGVLCPKPECTHDEAGMENKNCGGFVNSHAKSLFSSGEKLFYVSGVWTPEYKGPALFRMNSDGTGREMVRELDFGETQDFSWPQRFDLHRGKLYGWISYEYVEESEPIIRFAIVSLDPETGEYRTIYEKDDCGMTIWPKLFYIDGYVYFSVPDAGPMLNTSTLEIFRWNIETEELEKLYSSDEAIIFGGMYDMWVENDGNIWLVPETNFERNPELMQILNGELKVVFEYPDFGSAHLIGGGTVNITYPGQELIITDMSGNVLKRIEKELSFFEDIGFNVDAYGCDLDIYGDINELFVVYSHLRFVHDGRNMSYGSCLVRYDLTEDEPQAQLLAVSPWD